MLASVFSPGVATWQFRESESGCEPADFSSKRMFVSSTGKHFHCTWFPGARAADRKSYLYICSLWLDFKVFRVHEITCRGRHSDHKHSICESFSDESIVKHRLLSGVSCCDWLLLHDDSCLSSRCIVPARRERGPFALCFPRCFPLVPPGWKCVLNFDESTSWLPLNTHTRPRQPLIFSHIISSNFLFSQHELFVQAETDILLFLRYKTSDIKKHMKRNWQLFLQQRKVTNDELTMLIAIDFWCCCCRGGGQSSD